MFKFFLNQIETSEAPEGWEDYNTTLKNDSDLKGLFKLSDTSLTFWGDGYTTIKNAFDTDGHCGQMDFEVRQYNGASVYTSVFTGILFLKNVEFGEGINGSYAKCKIEDNSFFAKVFNNRNLKAKIYSTFSKNGEVITACPYNRLQYFNPSSGSYYVMFTPTGNYVRNNTCFTLFDLLTYMVAFVSDGEMDFYSDTFGTGGIYEEYVVTNEFTVRYSQTASGVTQSLFETNWPEINFADCFKELDKEFNLGFVAGFDGSRAYLRVEAIDYLFPTTVLHTFQSVANIRQKTYEPKLYGKLIAGSTDTINAGNLSFPGGIRFVGFRREEYYISGKCNTDRELDLVNNWVIDSNLIEDLVINGASLPVDSTDTDTRIILVHAPFDSGTGVYKAAQSNWVSSSGDVFYNETLNTDNKTRRYLGGIPNNIALQLGTVDNTFSAEYTSQVDATNNGTTATVQDLDPVQVNLELADPNSNYDPATFRYTCPNGGLYTFNVQCQFRAFNAFGNPSQGSCTANIFIWLKNNTTGYEQLIYTQPNSGTVACGSIININTSGTLNCSASDDVQLHVQFYGFFAPALLTGTNLRLISGLRFACTASADGGGVYQTYNPDEYSVINYKFEAPLSYADFQTIAADPRGQIEFYVEGGKTYLGWIDEIKYNHFEKMANVSLLSNKRINS